MGNPFKAEIVLEGLSSEGTKISLTQTLLLPLSFFRSRKQVYANIINSLIARKPIYSALFVAAVALFRSSTTKAAIFEVDRHHKRQQKFHRSANHQGQGETTSNTGRQVTQRLLLEIPGSCPSNTKIASPSWGNNGEGGWPFRLNLVSNRSFRCIWPF